MLSWTQDTVVAIPQALPAPKPKRKHSLLPILITLFLVSYGLMCLLAVEQDRTIAAQRYLIRSLLGDSSELSAMVLGIRPPMPMPAINLNTTICWRSVAQTVASVPSP